jgi:predicted transcriptional regulator
MTATTIKVSSELRDRLKQSAAAHGRTLGEHLEALLAEEARRERFVRLREQMAASPPDERYAADLAEWQGDGWT